MYLVRTVIEYFIDVRDHYAITNAMKSEKGQRKAILLLCLPVLLYLTEGSVR